MDLLSECKASEVFEGQVVVYKHMHAYIDSMCLKWCLELNIADIIHKHGQPITLHDLVSTLQVPPSKISGVHRLMRHLAHNGFFDIIRFHDNNNEEEKEAYALTVASKLLVKGTQHSLAPMTKGALDPTVSGAYHFLGKWTFEDNLTLFDVSLGTNLWEFFSKNPSRLSFFNESMISDSQMLKLGLKDHGAVFEGLESIVDVGGGNGTISKIINAMFPELKCIVFDLPHVVENLSGSNNNLSFVGGDMFHSIPHADAILLKIVECTSRRRTEAACLDIGVSATILMELQYGDGDGAAVTRLAKRYARHGLDGGGDVGARMSLRQVGDEACDGSQCATCPSSLQEFVL
ncbi:Isoflavone 7-O-methyltransferase [Stylosanthes scabra]|uniref:Isoflavone 7-O-methyltransferase n=1 Tax=Stylosanthes scabra TaxID=79078 RepID=A0ABU6UBI9_9FABA|nr:Isoflavone 7-O-methyltransferase [Stylosanthes scabra]